MDLTIEQKLMRNFKTSGLTRGRGITESTVAQFVAALPLCVPLCERLESFCRVRREASEQHVELRSSTQARDQRHFDRFYEWFETHPPFEQRNPDMLVSLSTGVVADSTINCDKAWEIGFASMVAMHGNNFADVKLKRKDKVKPLSAMVNNITVQGETIAINPTQLLHRIVCVLNAKNGNLAEYLEYELCPKPPSLFDDVSFRKTDKSALGSAIATLCPPTESVPSNTVYVVDGGMLLRAVVWPRPATYKDICEAYVQHVIRRYGSNATVVFDGYEAGLMSTKSAEQQRRTTGKTSPTLTVRADIVVSTAQANFLGNGQNKTNLIHLLKPALEEKGIRVLQDPGDADALTVAAALQLAENDSLNVAVAASDTDILAMLIQRREPSQKLWFFAPGTSGRAGKAHNIEEVQKRLGRVKSVILFAHAFTGCDTTSAIFNKGKASLLKILQGNEELCKEIEVFSQPDADVEKIVSCGEKVLLALYPSRGVKCNTLNELRFALYNKLAATQKLDGELQLKTLPPTSAAARQHSLRTYLQVS